MFKFIDDLGDWNHAFIGVGSMFIISLIGFTGWAFITTIIYFMAFALTFFYLGKEYQEHIRLGVLKAFYINLWTRHNRRQSIIVWSGVWLYAVIYDKFIFNFIQ